MHEFGPAEGIVEAVLNRAAGRRVRHVRVRAGALHRFDPAALSHAFALCADGTPAAGADLDLVVTPVRTTCRTCGVATETTDPLPVCSACGGTDLQVISGNEVILECLEYEPEAVQPAEFTPDGAEG
jgi:hydrogenase nickel incorporation protein HypA/HybF